MYQISIFDVPVGIGDNAKIVNAEVKYWNGFCGKVLRFEGDIAVLENKDWWGGIKKKYCEAGKEIRVDRYKLQKVEEAE
jgi:hypothetical protein